MAGKRKAAETSSKGGQQMGIQQAWSAGGKPKCRAVDVLQREWDIDVIPCMHLEDSFKDLSDHVREADKDNGREIHYDAAPTPAAPLLRRTERGHKPNRRFNDGSMIVEYPSTTTTNAPPDAASLRTSPTDTKKQERVLLDLEKLQHVFPNSRSLPVKYQARLVELVHKTDRRSRDDIALAAYRVWHQRFQALPACKVSSGEDGKPVLLVNEHCWTPMHSKTRPMMQVVNALKHAADVVKTNPEEQDPQGKAAGTTGSVGQLLMLKLLVLLVQQDLLARVHVSLRHRDKTKEAGTVLKDSILWRMFDMDDSGWKEREDIIGQCVQIIIATTGPSSISPVPLCGSTVISRTELGGLARTLLGMLCELYSVAEDLGVYRPGNTCTRGGNMKNDRYCLDHTLKELLVGTNAPAELKEPEAKQGVLLSLPHRDCVRFLACVLGTYDERRPKQEKQRTHDARLEEYLDYSENFGRTANSFFWIDPVMVLEYIRQHWHWAKSFVFEGGLDCLLVFISCLVTAAAHCTQPMCSVDKAALLKELIALQQLPDLKEQPRDMSPNILCHWLMAQQVACSS